jgi:hypothetical protein
MRKKMTRPLLTLCVACLLAGLGPAVASDIEHEGPRAPAPTDQGRFEGTWVRIEPGERHGVQLRRAEDGSWDIRLYWVVEGELTVDTDWKPHHDYEFRGYPGFFELDVIEAQSSEDELIVDYLREAEGERDAHMVETGDVTLYRSGGDGRTLVWVQKQLVREVEVGDALYPDEAHQRTVKRKVWVFRKESERNIPWDDVYW